mgnify:FL=1|jgi:uncharacterized membrane protein
MYPLIYALLGFIGGFALTFQFTDEPLILICGAVISAMLSLSMGIPEQTLKQRLQFFLMLLIICGIVAFFIYLKEVHGIDLGPSY